MHKDDEWGNIELPGISDEELFDPQITTRLSNKRRKGDAAFKENCSRAQYKSYEDGRKAEKIRQAKLKPFVTPWGKFPGGMEFNKWIQKEITSIKLSAGDKAIQIPHLYYYEKDGPGEILYELVKYTPYGNCPPNNNIHSLRKIHEQACEQGDPEALKNKRANEWFMKMCNRDPENYYTKKEIKREWLLNK